MKRLKTNSLGARVLSGFMSLLMIMSACPISAYAEYEEPESTTIVVSDESESENEDTPVVISDNSENKDENIDSIPTDENAEDQNNPDVETPPNIDGSDEPVVDPENPDPTQPTEGDQEEVTPEYTYSVTLPDDAKVSEGDTLAIAAEVVAIMNKNGETSDVEYRFEFTNSNDEVISVNKLTNTSAEFTFNKDGDYTIDGTMYVDDEEVAKDTMNITVEKELPVVEFDHYFTEIDESLVETSDLIVTTDDASIFTKNTNVVSNFDNAYIIECASVQEAKYVYSYYVDKVDSISDLSKIISIATDENDADVADLTDINEGNDALSQLNDINVTDYSGYIALIDTGANAEANFSVVGDDTSDHNGHGTKMYSLIRTYTDTPIMSIKVFNGDKTDAASVYAGIKLAIESNVSIINLSLTGSDIESNAIVKDAIQEALDKGIVVIGAAGNYNMSSKKFIPGCIDGVIVIGAANPDGTKFPISNTDADYYVVAESTSEATALFTGIYASNYETVSDNMVFNGEGAPIKTTDWNMIAYVESLYEAYPDAFSNLKYNITEDGEIEWYVDLTEIEGFETAAAGESFTPVQFTGNYRDFPENASGSYTGSCTVASSGNGSGTASGFSGPNLFYTIWSGSGSPGIPCSCDRHWGDSTLSKGAKTLSGPCSYRATVESCTPSSDGSQLIITFLIEFDASGTFGPRTWNTGSASTTWKVYSKCSHVSTGAGDPAKYDVGYSVGGGSVVTVAHDIPSTGFGGAKASVITGMSPKISEACRADIAAESGLYAGYNGYTTGGSWPSATTISLGASSSLSWTEQSSGTATASWKTCSQMQVFKGRFAAWRWRYTYVTFNKSSDSTYDSVVNSSNYYDLSRAHFYATHNGSQLYDVYGNAVQWNGYAGQEFTLAPDMAYETITIIEDNGGKGYFWNSNMRVTDTLYGPGEHKSISMSNRPMYDPANFSIKKAEDTTGKTGSNWAGNIEPISATYRVRQYELSESNGNTGHLENTWYYHTDSQGKVDFENPSYCDSNPPRNPGNSSRIVWPIGYYVIQETVVAKSNGNNTGTKIATNSYTYTITPTNGPTTSDSVTINMWRNSDGARIITNDRWNPDFKITLPDGSVRNGVEVSNELFYDVEPTQWNPLGLFKADNGLINAGYINNNGVIGSGQGDAIYAGAEYLLYTTDNTVFPTLTYNPNGAGNILSCGAGQLGVTAVDGFGNSSTTSFGTTLYPVLYNGEHVKITTNANGTATTGNIRFPQASTYRFVEVKAPEGYQSCKNVAVVKPIWTTGDDASNVTSLVAPNETIAGVAAATAPGMSREGTVNEPNFYYSITARKLDDYNTTGQGSGTVNGIRFALVNRSDRKVVTINNWDTQYVQYNANQCIQPGQVVAILTTHTVDGKEGVIRMNGLPYGRYELYELRHDATIAVGDVYNGSNKLGSSIYANPSYIWSLNDSGVFALKDQNFNHDLVLPDQFVSVDASNPNYDPKNTVFVDGLQGYKLDSDYLQISEGDSSLDDIEFAVVNVSAREVRLQSTYVNQSDSQYIDYLPDTQIAPGHVAAILTTHTGGPSNVDGYFNIYGLPYGQYVVYELRKDNNVNVNDVWDNADKGTSIYANDSYYFDNVKLEYNLTDTTNTNPEHAHTMANSFTRHYSVHAATENVYKDPVFRDGFSFWKRDFTFNTPTSHPQGDATYNDIRFVVVNRSEQNIKLYDKYNTVETAYSQIVDGKIIAPGQVAAILTSHQKGDLEGYVAIMGLPYGQYDVYELSADSTIQIGDVYTQAGEGTSIYANAATNSPIHDTNGRPSMLANDTLFQYDLTDTGVHVTSRYETNKIHTEESNAVTDTSVFDRHNAGIREDETVYGSIKIVKYDKETGQTGVDGNQGTNSFAGIKYAVVNRSNKAVSYPYDDDSADAYYRPGEVITIAVTDENGEVVVEHMCYGSYDVYELRQDSTLAPHDVYNTSQAKYGTDHRANHWYCWNESLNNVQVTNNDLQTIAVNYVVTPQEGRYIRTQNQQNQYDWQDLPIRGDLETIKVNIDGDRMPHIPFLVSLLAVDENYEPIKDADGNFTVIEQHIIVSNDKGELNTRDFVTRPKTPGNINTLDGLYEGIDFTGTVDQLMSGQTANIWFGTPDEYLNDASTPYLTNKRGSLLAGVYQFQELRLTEARFGDLNTEDYDMISSFITITEDNLIVYPDNFDIGVDIPIYITSEAMDNKSESNAIVPDAESSLKDTIEFGNLNSTQNYAFTSKVTRVKLDGTIEVLYEDEKPIPLQLDNLVEMTKDANGVSRLNGAKVLYDDATNTYSVVSTKANADPVFKVVHDFSVIRNVDVDSSMCEEGEYLAFSVNLYKSVGNGYSLLKQHNQECNEPTQKVGVISLTTHATNKTTDVRVGSLGGYAYTEGKDTLPVTNTNSLVYNKEGEIVGYTIIDDTVTWTNLADKHNYRLYAQLVDDDGNAIKDIYGNDCILPYLVGMYATSDVAEVTQATNIVDFHGNILERNLDVPRDGSFTFSDLGLMDWIVPNGTTAHVVITLYDARGPILKMHNKDFDEEDENIRWIDIKTTAMGEDGEQGVLPNGKSWDLDGNLVYDKVTLRDRIDYTNLAEPITIRVEGNVYLVDIAEDGTRSIAMENGEPVVVAKESKTFDIADVNGSVEMQYTVDSGKYEARDLVVCERVYMDVDHKYTLENGKLVRHEEATEVLIALHEDINDPMQTVSIPKIETHLVNKSDDTVYKVVSQRYADVTLYDTVTYQNLKPGMPWTVTATLMDQTTKVPVKDENGNNVTAQVTFTPDKENGEVVVPVTFKQVLTSLDWEINPSWVCFENLKPGVAGHTDLTYALHNNINDDQQTVHLPTFRTTVSYTATDVENVVATATNTTDRQILAAPNQKVTDKVEIKNVGLDTIVDENHQITGFIPNTFTLEIQPFDADADKVLLKADGTPYSDTVNVTVSAKVVKGEGENASNKYVATVTYLVNGKEFSQDFEYDTTDGVYTKNDGEIDWTVVKFGTDKKPLIVTIDQIIDGTNLKGKTIAFHEKLYFGETAKAGSEVLVEDSNEHVEQMVTVPAVSTTAVDPITGEHTIIVSGEKAEADDWYMYSDPEHLTNFDWKINDSVDLNKITPETDYTLVTIVMNKETNKPVMMLNAKDGKVTDQMYVKYTNISTKSTADANEKVNDLTTAIECNCGKENCCGVIAVNGNYVVELNLNETEARNGGTFVVYEYLLIGKNNTSYVPKPEVTAPDDCYAYHNDITDEEQTVIIPSIETMFLDNTTEIHVVPYDEEEVTVTDTVHYEGLVEGKKYTMQAVLMDKTTSKPIVDNDGNMFTEEVEFVAGENGEGDVIVEFTIDNEFLHTFDTDLAKNHITGTPETSDEDVTNPDDDTTTDGNVTEDNNTTNTDTTATDTDANADDKDADDEDSVSDNTIKYNGKDARTEVGVTDEDRETVSHSTRMVAFERCVDEDKHVIGIHGDIQDEDQTILIPRIFTHLTDTVIGDHVSRWNTKETITDTVTFVSLQADKEYTINGYLVDVDTGEPVLDKNGDMITATKTFTPNDPKYADQVTITTLRDGEGGNIASGSVDLVFEFDSTALKGTHVVAFEDCKYNDILIATHSDINDEWQWMFIPEIGTILTDKLTEDKMTTYGPKVELIDTVEYNKLLPGVWYEMTGTVMDKETGKPLVDKDGKAYTASTRFMPEDSSGTVDVVFTIDTTVIEGKTLVAFEECYYVGAKKDGTPVKEPVAEHKDIKDDDQTVYVPKIRTTAEDKADKDKAFDGTKTSQTVVDTVKYTNLVVGKEYTIKGKLAIAGSEYDENGNLIKDKDGNVVYQYVKDSNGNVIVAEKKFTPKAPANDPTAKTVSGEEKLEITFDASLYAGQKLVVFEDLYYKNIRVATHSDIEDEDQTIQVSLWLRVMIEKSDFNNHSYRLKNAEITIYEDKECTKIAKDINGNDCVGKTGADGLVEFVIITYDRDQIFYAKETKAPFGYKLCKDIFEVKADDSRESAGVCKIDIKILDMIIVIPPKTGDDFPILPITIFALIGTLCIGAFFALKPKKSAKDEESDGSDDAEEIIEGDSVVGMMTEDIDGGLDTTPKKAD